MYLQNLLKMYVPRRSLRSSHDNYVLIKPAMKYKSYGERSFSFYGPFVWNSLPFELRKCDNINIFKKQLKTYFFQKKLMIFSKQPFSYLSNLIYTLLILKFI